MNIYISYCGRYVCLKNFGITESWANTDITDAGLGLTGYVMFRRDRIGRGEGELFYMLTNLFRLMK